MNLSGYSLNFSWSLRHLWLAGQFGTLFNNSQ